VINEDALRIPEAGLELVEVRFANGKDGTSSWLIKPESMTQVRDGSGVLRITLAGEIADAAWARHGDGRLDRAIDNSNRLLSHLRKHCPALLGTGECNEGN